MASQDTATITSHCLCKAHIFKADVPRSSLPLIASVCHCTSCRHSTGALYTSEAPWPMPASKVDTSTLKSFAFSDTSNILFCGTCSTPIFWSFPTDPDADLIVLTGTLQNDACDLVKIERQIFVGDTLDGGASPWLRAPNADGEQVKRYEGYGGELGWEWPPASALTGYEARGQASVPVHCKCRGVDFVMHAGSYAGKGREEVPWYVDPVTHKNVANFDACDSCRLWSGIDLFHWTFTSMEHLTFKDGKPFPKDKSGLKALVDARDPSVGTLRYYASSPDVQRYFCGNCSASVIYAVDTRPTVIDIAVGLIGADDGARAEGFLSWDFGGRVGHRRDVEGGWREGLAERVEKESEEWRIARGYPKCWRRVAREKGTAVEH
ncbi:hypothetical protein BS50DRAFT_572530 [Corynespora cassiicola Philippines]|uniref:CENP-V/GFA domain-containing protein n=1 Tax=Corynespora cassiicola Philippines TaxID=1448308 RepID=A0A2T2NVC5_CORCC|nr:hypothetical protein BS50DRAFT_572530 [Corynespora cassiicola Philippines]